MNAQAKELLAKKRKLQQDIKHIDACLTMFSNFAVVCNYGFIDRVFSNFKDAYDYVAKNNRQLDRRLDKWHRSVLSFIAYEWDNNDDQGDPVRVYPDIWENHPEYGWYLKDQIFPVDAEIHSPFGQADYQPTDEDLYGSFP